MPTVALAAFIGWRQEFNHRHKLMKQVTTEAPPALKTLDPGLPTDLTTAQYRLAVIQRELGSTEQVQSANAAAIQQLESLRHRHLGGVDLLSILAQAYSMAGRHEDSIALCQKILETDAKHREARSTLAESCNSLAIDEKSKKDAAIALSDHQKAFELRQQLANKHPAQLQHQRALAAQELALATAAGLKD